MKEGAIKLNVLAHFQKTQEKKIFLVRLRIFLALFVSTKKFVCIPNSLRKRKN